MSLWTPVACSLQLNLTAAAELREGSPYNGVSTIRYRRGDPTPADLAATQPSRWAHGLQLHAATRIPNPTRAAAGPKGAPSTTGSPLTVQQYKLARLRPSAPLRITSIKESKDGTHGEINSDAGAMNSDPDEKTVIFSDMDDDAQLPVGSEVELTIAFSSTIKGPTEGGIYVGPTRNCGAGTSSSSTLPPLLTHFEVHLARTAFPCPDDPVFRLEWTLSSLQLPSRYATVITHTAELDRRESASSTGPAVHLRFGTVGPLPAYVFAFAAFPHGDDGEEPLLTLETEIHIPSAASCSEGGVSEAPLSLPVSAHARRASGVTEATLQETLNTLTDAVAFMTDFFACPLPLCGCDGLRLLIAPTMPYISGMEHHGCIFLNQSIFQDTMSSDSARDALVRAELIAHEVAHHWIGNRVGFSFAVKEGVCQVLEQLAADTYLGRSPRPLIAIGSGGANAAAASPSANAGNGGTRAKKSGKGGVTAGRIPAKKTITETTRGKEFTGQSYQLALAEVQNRLVECGLGAFRSAMRTVMRDLVLRVEAEVEAQGGREVMRYAGLTEEAPPYLTTDAFLARLANSSDGP